MKNSKKNISTTLSRVGVNPKLNYGIPNPPVYHASTILYPNSKSHRTKKVKYQYGRFGTPTSETFCNAIADLYDADGSIVARSGLAAAVVGISTAETHILSQVSSVFVKSTVWVSIS